MTPKIFLFLINFFKEVLKACLDTAGFRNTILNDFIIEYFDKEEEIIIKYIEYGCPCWGPLSYFFEKQI